jgi:hypothetical protein
MPQPMTELLDGLRTMTPSSEPGEPIAV